MFFALPPPGGPPGAPLFFLFYPLCLRCGEHLRCSLHWWPKQADRAATLIGAEETVRAMSANL